MKIAARKGGNFSTYEKEFTMLKRIITAAVCIAVFIPVLMFSDTLVFPIVLGVLALIAIFEITGCVDVRRKYHLSLPSYLFVAVSFVLMTVALDSYMAEKTLLSLLFALGYAYLLFIFAVTMLTRGNIKFSQAAELVSTTLYILIGFLSILVLRRHETGKYLYLLVFLGAWMTDTGAYFFGKFLGKRKLIPEVSPNKTVAGAFGGIVGCIVGYIVYALILQTWFEVRVNYWLLIALAAVIAVISQFGDLIASYIKRERGIKDYGFLFPGHGGVMDRFDSVIAVSPVLTAIVLLLPDNLNIFEQMMLDIKML